MAREDVNMLDCTWLHEQRLAAKRTYLCLAFIYYNGNGEACQKLHESCGFNSLHSLKLAAFTNSFCEKYLATGTDVLDPSLNVQAAFTCDDVSASILEVLADCDSNGWKLNVSSF